MERTQILMNKTEDIYVDISKDAERRLDTSNHELDKPLQKGKK